ncbi:MAG: ATP-dependent RNA helicase RhlE [Candidatus Latescibacteria bacterium ADurb.Bin168]|nr:MAG: ATP-dependent RNA helicase RhlE [Candidatus Latescibacteria bacterium ADurb.Bin168]
MNTNPFHSLGLDDRILRALVDQSYETPTPVQLGSIPRVLEGRDLLATAQTGTGKTAAFCLPMLHLLNAREGRSNKHVRALILTPTRELALQIGESLRTYGRYLPLRFAVLLGGVAQAPQAKALREIPDIVVATPGRLLDLHGQRLIQLDRLEILVLDEADRMLDMGFVRDVRKIVSATPATRQTLFFSATLSPEIAELASDMVKNPAVVAVTPVASVSDNITQKVLFVEQADKLSLLTEILREDSVRRALVFARTKHGADRIVRQLERKGIRAEAIHSNKSQNARQTALAAFDRGRTNVLVATDIVARGIDVDGITHVINFDLPNEPEAYVHRIGRTARAGAVGTALSFCGEDEVSLLFAIEKLTTSPLSDVNGHAFHSTAISAMRDRKRAAQQGTGSSSRFVSGRPRRNHPLSSQRRRYHPAAAAATGARVPHAA